MPPRLKMAHEMDAPDGDLRLGARSRRRLFGVVDDGDGDEGGRDVDVEFEAFDSEDEAAGDLALDGGRAAPGRARRWWRGRRRPS